MAHPPIRQCTIVVWLHSLFTHGNECKIAKLEWSWDERKNTVLIIFFLRKQINYLTTFSYVVVLNLSRCFQKLYIITSKETQIPKLTSLRWQARPALRQVSYFSQTPFDCRGITARTVTRLYFTIQEALVSDTKRVCNYCLPCVLCLYKGSSLSRVVASWQSGGGGLASPPRRET